MCRADPSCHSWMRRNSAGTCYLSVDSELRSGGGSDHHPHTLNAANCLVPPPSPPPPPPPYAFTTKASLKTAVEAYNANPTTAIATYGPIADWDVSAITDMSGLFYKLKNFDADVSNWDTSGVTTMREMFKVLSTVLPAGRRRPRLLARTLPPHRMAPFRFSADCEGVQPAAELRHLQRHDHA
eukprot:scaffold5611_cov48-Phaeocystis_antarctica.AAC.1